MNLFNYISKDLSYFVFEPNLYSHLLCIYFAFICTLRRGLPLKVKSHEEAGRLGCQKESNATEIKSTCQRYFTME
jgi:hypothetical protein